MNKSITLFRFSINTAHTALWSGLFLLFCLNTQAQSLKVGFTRIDYIIAQTPEAKAVSNQLSVQQTQVEGEYKRMQKEFDEKYATYQKGSAQMTETIRKDRETELQNLQTRIQEFGRSAQESLQAKYKQLMGPVLSRVQQAIDTVAKQKGYAFVLSAGAGNSSNILYASEENDVTDAVLKQLGIVPGQVTKAPEKPAKAPAKPVSAGTPKKK
ncbi:OmpH/Skp family outer membrane protein [Spirosoma agri]|uniref:OmpH family outer membrane protein n=1 Tax=Spirosoma agri TaxID=1987381 RepID=A0A6M0IL43_9BACT|nr:OmpH family outer membrane protein [Spirosoma agri]NEU68617.1 OmpH family outer membrane protein [Spirosoma agri]